MLNAERGPKRFRLRILIHRSAFIVHPRFIMLVPVPADFHPPRGRRKPRRRSVPPPAALTILEVLHSSPDTNLIVEFSGAIAWDGVTVPQGFKAWTHDGLFDPPVNVIEVSGSLLRLEFNAGVSVGAEWIVDGVMEGITPGVVVPQDGTVIE